jgi:thiol-disulfide isomerase/thioredoxin
LQRFSPWIKRLGPRVWDALALAALAFALWKVFVAPRDLSSAHARPAPHAVYAKVDGGTFRVADQRGRVLFLDFFATWCVPCKIELPLVERWAAAHPRADVVLIDVGEPSAVVRSFARAHHLRDVALDPQSSAQAFFGVHGFPTVVVIDPQGRIRAKWAGLNPAIALALTHAQSSLAVR